ncbi:cytochrome c1 [Agitococcus lubricus]|uniref:Ubiquinol-cytochrome c reductase cytochrome c1 subunit n=1 Tax=Agitococcus lubricus TaxID=1077255 RepID=A0A2T5J0M9_9GAMM|nr:cytochrome c1 [Agitococcus lubricus]PTQ89887.1 ubiquinol-cytochrome c reductase cytochrome c1 subunit [Agitococcus lubricus]
MKKFFLLFALLLSPAFALAGGGGACGTLAKCDKAPVDLHNKESLQNGAKIFISYCLGCHSAKYLRYERMATDLEIDPKLVQEYMMFTTDKIGDGMDTKVNKKDQAKWFGNAPPDLSLETRLRSPDWVYTYLLNFYPDDKRPWGVNNRVFKDVAMPHVLDSLELELGPDDYKVAVGDLVNFMTYMAEPIRTERERLGWWVLAFLAILFVPVYLLNKEFWKDVK